MIFGFARTFHSVPSAASPQSVQVRKESLDRCRTTQYVCLDLKVELLHGLHNPVDRGFCKLYECGDYSNVGM